MDRRIQKTRTGLVHGLRQLMLRYPWESISVAMICQEAEVSRSTYYAHFSGKQELLELSIASLANELTPARSNRGLSLAGSLRFLPAFLTHIESHRDIYLRNQTSAAMHVILENLRRMTQGLVRYEVQQSRFAGDISEDKLLFVCGGLSALLESWNADACREPEAHLLGRLDALTKEFLA